MEMWVQVLPTVQHTTKQLTSHIVHMICYLLKEKKEIEKHFPTMTSV